MPPYHALSSNRTGGGSPPCFESTGLQPCSSRSWRLRRHAMPHRSTAAAARCIFGRHAYTGSSAVPCSGWVAPSALSEEHVSHAPLIAAAVCKQLGAGEVEQPPAGEPPAPLRGTAVCRLKEGHNLLARGMWRWVGGWVVVRYCHGGCGGGLAEASNNRTHCLRTPHATAHLHASSWGLKQDTHLEPGSIVQAQPGLQGLAVVPTVDVPARRRQQQKGVGINATW